MRPLECEAPPPLFETYLLLQTFELPRVAPICSPLCGYITSDSFGTDTLLSCFRPDSNLYPFHFPVWGNVGGPVIVPWFSLPAGFCLEPSQR